MFNTRLLFLSSQLSALVDVEDRNEASEQKESFELWHDPAKRS